MTSESRKVTKFEVECHNSTDDKWIELDGKVYNFTSFAKENP